VNKKVRETERKKSQDDESEKTGDTVDWDWEKPPIEVKRKRPRKPRLVPRRPNRGKEDRGTIDWDWENQ
jgi:hypothetical protein